MSELQTRELQTLRRLLGRLIPASAEYRVPGADDKLIFQPIAAALMARAALVRELLVAFDYVDMDACTDGDIDLLLEDIYRGGSRALSAILPVVAQHYYTDDRVMISLGSEPRPPFPRGYEVSQGDWSLLEPVREMAPIWRPVP